jgi:hypothetical protein
MNRRNLIVGLVSFLAAPAIVRAGSLVRVSGDIYKLWDFTCPLLPPIVETPPYDIPKGWLGPNGRLQEGTWTFFGKTRNIYPDKCVAFSKREYD